MKEIINTSNAPKPLGPYNQAVKINNMLFMSGQIGINPKNNQIIKTGIQDETTQVMENLKSVLKHCNLSFDNVVKTSIFLTSMSDFDEVNSIYGTYFNESTAPARETIAVSTLPKNVNVEISMIACFI